MPEKTIAIASDHAGFELKQRLILELKNLGYKVEDFGTNNLDSVDYPDYAEKLTAYMGKGKADTGVLICGSGIGMSIAANRHPFIRAALVRDMEDAILARQHNNANVIVFGGRKTDPTLASDMLKEFLTTPFMEGRHTRRVDKLSAITPKNPTKPKKPKDKTKE